MNQINLAGRAAIVTGGSGGLGRAIMARLRVSGARVANLDHQRDQTPDADATLVCEITDQAAVEDAVAKIIATFGRIDILVNNAGIAGGAEPIAEIPLATWRRVIDVNLTGAFICTRAVVPHMVAQGYGRIVNMSSLRAKEAPAGSGAYAASKAALIALTKTLAKEVATKGVLVNCITPTAIDGGMSDGDDEDRAGLIARIPMNRYGRPDEVAAMTAWLASEECSFSTGAVFDLSGGRATW